MTCKPTTLAAKYGSAVLAGQPSAPIITVQNANLTQGLSVSPRITQTLNDTTFLTAASARPAMLFPQSSIFEENIKTFAEILRAEQNPVDNYDRTTLIRIAKNMNTSLRRIDLTDYPTLKNRMSQGNVLYTEIADFLNQSSFDIEAVDIGIARFIAAVPPVTSAEDVIVSSDLVSTNVAQLLEQLDFYYSENAANNISGGFCGAFANPFKQILDVVSAIQVGQDLLSKLLSFSLSFSFNLADLLNPLNTIKNMLLQVVDKLKETLEAQLKGVASSVVGIVSNLKDIAQSTMEYFNPKIQAIGNFLKDFSIDTIKDKLEGFIDDAKNQFEEMTPEAIALLLFRFCQFSEMIQSFMKAPIDNLKQIVSNFESSFALQLSRGLEVTSRAVAAGGIRFDEEARRRLRREASNKAAPNKDRAVEPRDRGPDGEYYASVEDLTPAERNQLANLTSAGFPGKFTFGPGVTNMDRDLGFTEVKPRVWVGLLKVVNRLQRMGVLSRPLLINSAYRSPAYNRNLAKRSKGVAKNSFHTTGLALDVNMAGMGGNDFERQFIRVASQEGFTAIGTYPNFIHIDMRDYRAYWEDRNSRHTSWLETHKKDGFRKGAAKPEPTSVLTRSSGPQ